MNLQIPTDPRQRIVWWTNFVLAVCLEAGAELKTCYKVAELFATGLEAELLPAPASEALRLPEEN